MNEWMNNKQVHECNLFSMMSFLIKLDKFVSLAAGSSVCFLARVCVHVRACTTACRFDLPADGNVLHFYNRISLSVSVEHKRCCFSCGSGWCATLLKVVTAEWTEGGRIKWMRTLHLNDPTFPRSATIPLSHCSQGKDEIETISVACNILW